MEPMTEKWITSSGGKLNKYNQNDYIVRNNWDNPDRTQRQGAWVGNSYNRKNEVIAYGLAGGVCLGLTGAYLVAGENWERFEAYLNGAGGKALVRGMMNYQALLYENKKVRLAKMVTNQILKSYNVNFIKKTKVLRAHVSKDVGNEILNNIMPGFAYCIRVYVHQGGHAIALRIDSGYIKLFDPNYGEVMYVYQQGRTQTMARFLTHLLSKYYAPIDSVYVERYSLR